VKHGSTYGVVTYSNAVDATAAFMKLSSSKGFHVALLDTREERGRHDNKVHVTVLPLALVIHGQRYYPLCGTTAFQVTAR